MCLALPAHAQHHPCAKGERVEGRVAPGGAFSKFMVEQDRRTLKLTDVFTLQDNPLTGRVSVFLGEGQVDRYNRMAAQVFVNKTWLQGELLQHGHGVIYGFGMAADCLASMRSAERVGRRAQRGVWAQPHFQLKSWKPKEISTFNGQFVVVQGRIMTVGDRKSRLYLNFGKNWSQDFTVSVVKRGKGAFKGNAVSWSDLSELAGSVVRVRGILEERQGPLIRLIDEAQIEILPVD